MARSRSLFQCCLKTKSAQRPTVQIVRRPCRLTLAMSLRLTNCRLIIIIITTKHHRHNSGTDRKRREQARATCDSGDKRQRGRCTETEASRCAERSGPTADNSQHTQRRFGVGK